MSEDKKPTQEEAKAEEKRAKRREYYRRNKTHIQAREKTRRTKKKEAGTLKPVVFHPKPPGFRVDIRKNPDFDLIVEAIHQEDLAKEAAHHGKRRRK